MNWTAFESKKDWMTKRTSSNPCRVQEDNDLNTPNFHQKNSINIYDMDSHGIETRPISGWREAELDNAWDINYTVASSRKVEQMRCNCNLGYWGKREIDRNIAGKNPSNLVSYRKGSQSESQFTWQTLDRNPIMFLDTTNKQITNATTWQISASLTL